MASVRTGKPYKTGKPCVNGHVARRGADGHCLACVKVRNEQFLKDNPDRKKVYQRNSNLRKYGLTQASFEAMLAGQNGKCAICYTSTPPAFTKHPDGLGGGWHVDHDHVSGSVRGILCGSCNVGLGSFADSPERLQRAAEYLL